jgi:hypothetical protein
MRPDGSRREEGSTMFRSTEYTRLLVFIRGGSGESRLFMWAASMVDV